MNVFVYKGMIIIFTLALHDSTTTTINTRDGEMIRSPDEETKADEEGEEGEEVQNSNQEEEEITLKRALFNFFHYLYSLIV